MADRNYISTDLANKLERARRRVQRTPQAHRVVPPPQETPTVSSLFRVYNNGSETIPEFGVMQVEELSEQYGQFSGETKDAYSVIQPDGEGSLFLINAGGEISEGHFGSGMFADEPTKSLFDPDSTGPSFMATIGPTSGEWHMSEDGTGFAWIGLPDEEEQTVIVRAKQDISEPIAAGLYGSRIGFSFNSSGAITKMTFLETAMSLPGISISTDGGVINVSQTDQTITIREAGLYQVNLNGAVRPASATDQDFLSCYLQFNSTADVVYQSIIRTSSSAGVYQTIGFSMPAMLDEDDELSIGIQTNGKNVDIHHTVFSVTKIG